MFTLERIDHIAITVTDIERSVKWYKEVLGLEHYYAGEWGGVPTMVGKGGTCIALFKVKGTSPSPTPDWNTLAMMHLAFRADRKNFEGAMKTLTEKGFEFEFRDHNISHSIYFKDPDGHELEITTYEV
ncbi:MAG: VOC family protein [Chlorobi bacterium]|nr:VOC family protein [Chlorobiota bacterium]MCI0715729.1 VOC family protein [Chlorobiota bacterium]